MSIISSLVLSSALLLRPDVNSSAIGVVPLPRQQDLGGTSCLNGACTAVFTDKHGAGTVTFELQYGGDCTSGYKSLFTTLTVKE